MDGEMLAQQKSAWRLEQAELKKQLITTDAVPWALGSTDKPLRLVGGVDISFYPDPSQPAPDDHCSLEAPATPAHLDEQPAHQRGVAALVVLTYPELQLVYEDFEPLDMQVPYCAGFLAFREVPAFVRLLERAAATAFAPQVVLVDGCGTLHYEGFGAACHLGVACGVPTVGVAKNLLMVEGLERDAVRQALEAELDAQTTPGMDSATDTSGPKAHGGATSLEAGNLQPFLIDRGPAGRCVSLVGSSGTVLGAALRPAGTKRPIYISVGHRLGLATSMELVWSCCRCVGP